MTYRLIRLPEVKHITGLSRSTIYSRMAQGAFPASVSLGGRLVAWKEQDVREWIDKQSNALKAV